jgi:hypothetical protein
MKKFESKSAPIPKGAMEHPSTELTVLNYTPAYRYHCQNEFCMCVFTSTLKEYLCMACGTRNMIEEKLDK